ncbi:hypothetical protein QAD02_019837 [Eretmocerus hayati]|uniref:Uncharacterized protein n=2 Tax=Eretmocerus hayati TaxID=131215 RepID=A0ACC2N0P1_9HYME|nr:hypothetical protein QAD02_006329 [Eretmocerus hayati]KAJ8684045.1 hypothetical protein QAD02_019837 [Eretmocerus hayati]
MEEKSSLNAVAEEAVASKNPRLEEANLAKAGSEALSTQEMTLDQNFEDARSHGPADLDVRSKELIAPIEVVNRQSSHKIPMNSEHECRISPTAQTLMTRFLAREYLGRNVSESNDDEVSSVHSSGESSTISSTSPEYSSSDDEAQNKCTARTWNGPRGRSHNSTSNNSLTFHLNLGSFKVPRENLESCNPEERFKFSKERVKDVYRGIVWNELECFCFLVQYAMHVYEDRIVAYARCESGGHNLRLKFDFQNLQGSSVILTIWATAPLQSDHKNDNCSE